MSVGVSFERDNEWSYSKVEGVSSNDLMRMGRRSYARGNERIGTLDGKLRTAKAQHILRGGRLSQQCTSGKSIPKHVEV